MEDNMSQILLKDKKYAGKYVAIEDFGSEKVIASGESPQEAYTKAIEKGRKDPVVFFVPFENMVQIY